jgi:hypothetical protein
VQNRDEAALSCRQRGQCMLAGVSGARLGDRRQRTSE